MYAPMLFPAHQVVPKNALKNSRLQILVCNCNEVAEPTSRPIKTHTTSRNRFSNSSSSLLLTVNTIRNNAAAQNGLATALELTLPRFHGHRYSQKETQSLVCWVTPDGKLNVYMFSRRNYRGTRQLRKSGITFLQRRQFVQQTLLSKKAPLQFCEAGLHRHAKAVPRKVHPSVPFRNVQLLP